MREQVQYTWGSIGDVCASCGVCRWVVNCESVRVANVDSDISSSEGYFWGPQCEGVGTKESLGVLIALGGMSVAWSSG